MDIKDKQWVRDDVDGVQILSLASKQSLGISVRAVSAKCKRWKPYWRGYRLELKEENYRQGL